jgi:hypothetical protein
VACLIFYSQKSVWVVVVKELGFVMLAMPAYGLSGPSAAPIAYGRQVAVSIAKIMRLTTILRV